ncbi:hypothetical protein [Christiangramia sediminis]|uniref:Uncharacterized protein n=1 Tax=Christiangramia sediminis TaxID=2881336 RepID=A0A9X1RWB2_9FLAO|nr:hypothetical protein [Christiangramia sediminis]MCB7480636.1 hypothetical protein [Christiangramia sediminis]
MEWIEILGIPGAGKSTLLKNLKSSSIKNDTKETWYAEETVKCGIIKNIKLGNFQLSNKLLQAKFLSNQKFDEEQKWKELIRIHREGVNSLELPTEFKFKLILFYSNLITKVSKYSNLYLSKPIFLDEGIIYNSYSKNIDLQNFIEHNYFFPKLVVYLEADVLEVANEIKNSNSFESRGMKSFSLFSPKEIRDYLQKKNSHTQDKINFLEKANVPVIKLNRTNSNRINDLININQRINEILNYNI